MARSSPEHKRLLVVGLKEKNIVATTGQSINDVKALQAADVGLSVGNKMCTEAAKEASDIVLLEGSFQNIIEALMNGRMLYANVRKFLQFQLTMNIVTMIVVFSGALINGVTPVTPA